MTGMYNNMALGLQGGVTSGFGPMSTGRASAGSTHRRFHPYCVGNQRSAYEASSGSGLSAGNHLSFSVEPGTYLLPESRPTLGAGSFLVNSLFYPDFLPTTTDIQQRSCQLTLDTNMQRNMYGPATEARSNFQVSSSVVRKDRDHPFYWRKRVEPAEGMTRTRDKYRVVYTEKQRKGLEQEYNTNKFITAERKAHISEELNLSMRQIKIWFQNRRAKERRDSGKNKDTEQTDSKNSIENVNSVVEHSPNSLPKSNFQTSCRFTGSDAQSKERLYSSEQFRLMNHLESGGYNSNRFASSNDCLFSSRDSSVPAKPVSPSEWDRPAENHYIPYLDVSPLTGNMNFDIELRL